MVSDVPVGLLCAMASQAIRLKKYTVELRQKSLKSWGQHKTGSRL